MVYFPCALNLFFKWNLFLVLERKSFTVVSTHTAIFAYAIIYSAMCCENRSCFIFFQL